MRSIMTSSIEQVLYTCSRRRNDFVFARLEANKVIRVLRLFIILILDAVTIIKRI